MESLGFSRLLRTPPRILRSQSSNSQQKPASNVVDPTKKSCKDCDDFDNEDMVRCDICDEWFHFVCAKVTREIENSDWSCVQCRVDNLNQNTTRSEDDDQNSKGSTIRPNASRKGLSVTSSTARKKKLTMMRIEEERRLKEARDKEYLDNKYKAIEDMSDSDSDIDTQKSDEESNANSFTSQWLNNLGNSNISQSQTSCPSPSIVNGGTHPLSLAQGNTTQAPANIHSTQDIWTSRFANDVNTIPLVSYEPNFAHTATVSSSNVRMATSHSALNNQQPVVSVSNVKMPSTSYSFLNQSSMPIMSSSNIDWLSNPVFTNQSSMPIVNLGWQPSNSAVINQQPVVTSSYVVGLSNNLGYMNQSSIPIGSSAFGWQPSNPAVINQQPVVNSSYVSGLSNNFGFVNQHPVSSFQNNSGNSVLNTGFGPSYGNVRRGRLDPDQSAARHAMPKNLPIFTGTPEEWPIFISAFVNSTLACGFSNSENLGRLVDCLKGDARETVSSMLLHPDSVPEIIQTLEMMYGRSDLVIETLLEKIKQEVPPKYNDLNSLIKFAMSVKNLCASIRNFGMFDHLQNPMLVKMLVDKLPTQIQINWAYFRSTSPNVNLAVFGDWLYNLARVTCQVAGRQKSDSSKKDRKDNQKLHSSKSNHVNAQSGGYSKNQELESNQSDSKQMQPQRDYSRKSESSQSNQNFVKCPICCDASCKQIQECKKFRSLTQKERWEMIKVNKLCSSCFGKHRQFKCRSRKKCQVEGCTSTHHALLHNYEKQIESTIMVPSTSQPGNLNSQRAKSHRTPAVFRIVPVVLSTKKKTVRTFAYLDDGSDLSLMESDLAHELGLLGTPDTLCVQWAFGKNEEKNETEIVSVRISGDFESATKYEMQDVFTVNKLFLPTQSISMEWLASYKHFKGIPISTYENACPRLLIGLLCSKLMVSLETVEGEWNDPIACRTRLGWVVQGPDENCVPDLRLDNRFSMNICECQQDNKLHELVKEFFSFESFGVRISEKSLESKEIIRARKILETTTVKKDGRFETGLLWRYDEIQFPDSYGMSLKRLVCLENKMKKDSIFAVKLCDQIQDFVEKKYIRKLLPNEAEQRNPHTWYLPLFVVFNPKKPLKFRTVWDAAAKVGKVSLNSVLLKGPDELVPLPDVLRRFRERQIAITGDIKEMFHQVRIREEDQCAQRFLWRNGETNRKPDVYLMEVMTFGATCSPSAAQFVKNKNALEYKDQFPRAVEAIIANHYIDDMIECTHTMEEAVRLTEDVKFIHQQASFEIRNFTSNSIEVLKALGENMNPQNKNLNLSIDLTTERILGMYWNTATDMFTYSLKYTKINDELMSEHRCPTKREVLRALMSIFDPLGLIANVLVYAKILLQKIWRKSTNWDDQISEELFADWLTWIKLLPEVEKIEIPRLYSPKMSPNSPRSIQIHTFVDASLEACAAVTFFRVEDEFGVDCSLVGAKTKVAPNKPLTVPRLELQAAVLGTRLVNSITNSQRIQITKKFFWSDSQTVISWIMSETRKYNQYVAFRIGEILENSEEAEWNWVRTEDNVADEATKWKNKPDLRSSSRWFKGPSFLYRHEEEWNNPNDKSRYITEEELRPRYLLAHFEHKTVSVIIPEEFSDWKKLLRTQAFVFRFIHNVRSGKKNRQVGPLNRSELIRAENHLYQQAQADRFMDEIVIIRHNVSCPIEKRKFFDKTSPLKTCSPYLDDCGVLRIKGRIDAAKHLPIQTKRPVILPRDHHITRLVVDSYHRKYHHMNHKTTLNEVNQKFFIPSLRRVLKSVIQNLCQRCKNDNAVPEVPEMADLPPARLATFIRPFTYVGIAYFGPFTIKVNRSKAKRWGVLVTCLTTRAIHIEVAHSLDTSSCIMAITNFRNRKGIPLEIYSDNGTNFHGSEKELRIEFEKLDKNKIQEAFTDTVTQWKFNPPSAPHMGGSWERLVRSVKSILYKTMPTLRLLSEEMFKSYIIEAENIINSRPLIYVSLDHLEDEVLTPNHFILGSSNGIKAPGEFNENHLLRDDWKAVQKLTNEFWRRFNIEFLPTLTRRTKWFKEVKPIEEGDLVIIVDEANDRNTWPKGIVEKVFKGKGGRVRQAIVRTAKNTYRRPVAKLAVLDVGINKLPPEADNGRKNVANGNSTPASHDN